MSREVRRVPLDFDFPLGETWAGYLRPAELDRVTCRPCRGSGYSSAARNLYDRWWGKVPFDPAETGSAPLTSQTPEVRAFAERNVSHDFGFYRGFHGASDRELVVTREAGRLCRLWNGMWCHHLHQDDVDALLAADRLWELLAALTALARAGLLRDIPTDNPDSAAHAVLLGVLDELWLAELLTTTSTIPTSESSPS